LKRIVLLVIALIILVNLTGCSEKNIKKINVEEKKELQHFLVIFNDFAKKQKIGLSVEELKAFRDITPQSVFDETGCQIFKNGKTCESYLLSEGKLYVLGFGFGGLGIVDIATSDFDNNGEKEVLYTYSFGSGLHRSKISCFDSVKKCEKEIGFSVVK